MPVDSDIWIVHLYNAITRDVDIAPGQVFSVEGSINIGNGLRLHVYSDDHGTHFHIRYQAGGIDARFSYPDIQLESYVSRKQFTSRQVRNIINTHNGNPWFSAFIKSELEKRST